MGKQASQGSTNEKGRKAPNQHQAAAFSTLNRMLLGQLAQPPETAVSTPLQQSISQLQAGFPTMLQNQGLGGGLADQLAGNPRTGGGALAAGPGQFGGQSRAQLGLPSRDSYFPFKPSPDELASLGAVPSISTGGVSKQKARYDKLSADETRTGAQERRLKKLQGKHPEWNANGG